MNFFEKINLLLKEALTFKQYKRMCVFFRILVGILMFPSYIVCFSLAMEYYFLTIIHKLFSLPADILEKFYKDQSKDVHCATQAVIYFVCLPFVFMLKVLLAFLSFFLGVYYFVLTIALQIATLNGITFKPFIIEEANRDYSPLEKMPVLNGLTFVLVCYLLLIASCLAIFVGHPVTIIVSCVLALLYIAFLIVYPICVFKKDGSNKSVNKVFSIIILVCLGAMILSFSGIIVGGLVKNNIALSNRNIEFEVQKNTADSYQKTFYISESGNYKFTFSKSVYGYIDSMGISNINTKTVYLEKGTHTLYITQINRRNTGSVFVEINYVE